MLIDCFVLHRFTQYLYQKRPTITNFKLCYWHLQHSCCWLMSAIYNSNFVNNYVGGSWEYLFQTRNQYLHVYCRRKLRILSKSYCSVNLYLNTFSRFLGSTEATSVNKTNVRRPLNHVREKEKPQQKV